MMNSSEELQYWHMFFSHLGSRVPKRTTKKVWMDLEHFIVQGCINSKEEPRLFTSFVILCIKLAPILSPFKIKKIAQISFTDHDYKVLGYVISLVQKKVRNKKQWDNLIQFCKKNAICRKV